MLATAFPYPPTHGGALRVWHVFRQVARHHRVTFLAMCAPGAEPKPEHVAVMREFAEDVILIPRPVALPWRLRNAARSFLGGKPYTIANYDYPAFHDALRRALACGQFDLVHAHCLHTAQYYPDFGCAARYFDCQNINVFLWQRYAEAQGMHLFRRFFALHQARLLERMEPMVHRQYDVTTFCSDLERDHARRSAPEAALRTSPNGVDCEFFAPIEVTEEPFTMVYSASMDAVQNSDSAVYFVRIILPLIRRRYPRSKLYLVGRQPPPSVQSLASDHVTVTGFVDDVRPYIARAAVYIVPTRIGGGTRLKILEAMSMGKAIVSTRVGAEGIDCTNGEDIVLADTPETFADAAGRLFDSPEDRRKLGEAGRRRALGQYDWSATGERILKYYEEAAANARERIRSEGDHAGTG
ncbi:MAG: polysaccharide biosynthesis protein PslH [Candidatus Hydrogenedentes bacterium]|nr:polysaccharide biosynthesis protein PslH [Candidatus Hydrogenedentota bacterium]